MQTPPTAHTCRFRLPRQFDALSTWRERLAGTARTTFGALLLTGLSLAATVPAARAQATATFTTLYRFAGSSGRDPQSVLVQGREGDIYGTTQTGGNDNGDGTAFRITPDGALTTIHLFNKTDGRSPSGALLLGNDGNFYGTTKDGGANGGYAGTVFKMTADGNVTTLHTFTGQGDGSFPDKALAQGSDGNFYGTTDSVFDAGTIFKITPDGVLTTLHTFPGDNGTPSASALAQGSDGNFYGTTLDDAGGGTVFKITAAGDLTTIYTLGPNDGAFPGGLVLGNDGNFYGTTGGGGANGYGTVFGITPAGDFTTVHAFSQDEGTGANRLLKGNDGNFYTAATGGGANDSGTVVQVTPTGVCTVLHAFTGSDDEQGRPIAGLTQASDGSFYGTADTGAGSSGDGTVFKLTVSGVHPFFFTGETALSNGVLYLSFPSGNFFGYYSYLTDPHYIFHFDLGYEYVFDAADGNSGVYLYDFMSNGFFYTSPVFPFPYLYDFSLGTVLYYYPDPNNAGHYNTDGYRFFYRFDNGQTIVK